MLRLYTELSQFIGHYLQYYFFFMFNKLGAYGTQQISKNSPDSKKDCSSKWTHKLDGFMTVAILCLVANVAVRRIASKLRGKEKWLKFAIYSAAICRYSLKTGDLFVWTVSLALKNKNPNFIYQRWLLADHKIARLITLHDDSWYYHSQLHYSTPVCSWISKSFLSSY